LIFDAATCSGSKYQRVYISGISGLQAARWGTESWLALEAKMM